jgi:hypothetical protein
MAGGFLLLAGHFAAEARESGPAVQIQMQVIAIDPEKALPLIRAFRAGDADTAAARQVRAFLAAGDAEVVGWANEFARVGKRSVSETIEEFRYATGAQEIPHSFEIRDLGVTLEYEVLSVHPTKGAHVNVVARAIDTDEMREFAAASGLREISAYTPPGIRVRRTTTSTIFPFGRQMLLSASLPERSGGRAVLFLVHLTLLPQ